MITKVKSCGLSGLAGYIVEVEIDLAMGIPAFDIVGLPDAAVKESRERVRAAIKNCGFAFPSRRVIINLAPAHIKKEGSFYDLPIAVSFLAGTEQLAFANPQDYVFLGELSLDGRLRRAAGVADVLPGESVYARVEEYRDSAVAYALRVWTTPAHYYDVRADLLDAVWREFKAAGVEMTYPHLVVHTPHEAIKQ